MKKQLATLHYYGTYRVVYNDSVKYNKYRIVHEYDGHTMIVEKYADLESCMLYLCNVVWQKHGKTWGV